MATEDKVGGVLTDHGTIVLDRKPALPPGPVVVVLQSLATPSVPQENWWLFMQRARHELEINKHPFMSDQEMAGHIEWLRESDPVDHMLQDRKTRPPQE